MHQFFRRYRLSIGWAVIILILTGIPGKMIPEVPSYIDLFEPDKFVHLFIFGVFVYTLMRGLVQEPGLPFNHAGWNALMISIAMGAITELLQVYVFIDRQGSIYDFIADSIGSLLAYLVIKRWRTLVQGPKNPG